MNTSWEEDTARPGLLLVECEGRVAPGDAGFRRDAVVRARAGDQVVLFLVADGAPLALPGSDAELDRFQAAGGVLAVDAFSLAQRGLSGAVLRPGTAVAEPSDLADWLLDNPALQAVWH